MQEDSQTAQDIFHRNNHSNPFKLKLPSHYAKHESILLMVQAFTLNKLALLPFYQSENLLGLYKVALEALLNQKQDVLLKEEFVQSLVWHLENWQINMGGLGSWQYTRAAFFSLEEKIKKNISLMEKVILKRAIHEPNKQQFVNKSQNMQFKSEELKFALSFCKKDSQMPDYNQEKEENYDLPQDLLFIDDDMVWQKAMAQYAQGKMEKQICGDYLRSYDKRGVTTYLRKKLREKNIGQVLEGLRLRQMLYTKVIQDRGPNLTKAIKILEQRYLAEK